MDALIERTQAYRQQAEDYRNDCIEGIHPRNLMFTSSDLRSLIANYKDFGFPPTTHTEFRTQLESLLSLLMEIPWLVFGRAGQKDRGGAREDREQLTEAHRKWKEAMAAEKVGQCLWQFSLGISFNPFLPPTYSHPMRPPCVPPWDIHPSENSWRGCVSKSRNDMPDA